MATINERIRAPWTKRIDVPLLEYDRECLLSAQRIDDMERKCTIEVDNLAREFGGFPEKQLWYSQCYDLIIP